MDISDHDGVVDDRTVQVVYTLEDSGDDAAIKRPSCIYLRRGHNTKHDGTLQYFRLDLEGRLEKVVTLKNKIDDDGNALREGRARIEEDPLDPAIQKAFKIERSYWMKDWLKKQSEGIPAGGKEAVSPVTNGTAP